MVPALTCALLHLLQNAACDDYINNNLHQALALCGAIPIVLTVDGVPDYRTPGEGGGDIIGEGGGIPRVDAAHPRWLHEVRRLMHDDTYYSDFLRRQRHAAVEDDTWPSRFHCAFHDVPRSRDHRRVLRWPRCRVCSGVESLPAKRKRPAEEAGFFVERRPCEGSWFSTRNRTSRWGVEADYIDMR